MGPLIQALIQPLAHRLAAEVFGLDAVETDRRRPNLLLAKLFHLVHRFQWRLALSC